MNSEVMALVLVAAAMHATWNALVKSGTDRLLDTGTVAGSATLICLALVVAGAIAMRF